MRSETKKKQQEVTQGCISWCLVSEVQMAGLNGWSRRACGAFMSGNHAMCYHKGGLPYTTTKWGIWQPPCSLRYAPAQPLSLFFSQLLGKHSIIYPSTTVTKPDWTYKPKVSGVHSKEHFYIWVLHPQAPSYHNRILESLYRSHEQKREFTKESMERELEKRSKVYSLLYYHWWNGLGEHKLLSYRLASLLSLTSASRVV